MAEETITVVSTKAFNIIERDMTARLPDGVHIGGLITHAIVPGKNVLPARLRSHWSLKAHGAVVEENSDAAAAG